MPMSHERRDTFDHRGGPAKVKPPGGFRDSGSAWLRVARRGISLAADAVALSRRDSLPRAGPGGIAVVAVHGLALGGAGKTPLVLLLAETLSARQGRPAAVGTRSAAVVADEIGMISRLLPSAPVFSCDDAAEAVRRAALAGCTAVVLDDPSLRRPAAAHVRIACLGPGDGWDLPAFPAGPRRPGCIRRSEVDVVALIDTDDPPVGSPRPVLRLRTRIDGVRDLAGGSRAAAAGPVYLLCGVARPARVLAGLAEAGFRIAGHAFLPDHQPIGPRVRAEAEGAAAACGAERIVVTEKDAARLPDGFAGERLRWAAIGHRLEAPDGLDEALRLLDRRVATPPAARR